MSLIIIPSPTQVTVDITHEKVHLGQYFSGGYYNSAVGAGTNLDILIQASSTYYTHAIFACSASVECTLFLYEDTTFSAAGTAVTMSNHNRASAKSFSGTVTHTPTVTGVGTQLNSTSYLHGGASGPGGSASPNGASFDGFTTEFILDLSTNYLFRITNISAGAARISARMDCYQPNL